MTTGRINQVDTSQYRNEADTPLSLARRWRRATLAPGGPLTRSVFIIASPARAWRETHSLPAAAAAAGVSAFTGCKRPSFIVHFERRVERSAGATPRFAPHRHARRLYLVSWAGKLVARRAE